MRDRTVQLDHVRASSALLPVLQMRRRAQALDDVLARRRALYVGALCVAVPTGIHCTHDVGRIEAPRVDSASNGFVVRRGRIGIATPAI